MAVVEEIPDVRHKSTYDGVLDGSKDVDASGEQILGRPGLLGGRVTRIHVVQELGLLAVESG